MLSPPETWPPHWPAMPSSSHVLTVYENEPIRIPASVPADVVARFREQQIREADRIVADKMSAYVDPLLSQGLPVTTLLPARQRAPPDHRRARCRRAFLVIGSHSKRRLLDIALGGTAKHVSEHGALPGRDGGAEGEDLQRRGLSRRVLEGGQARIGGHPGRIELLEGSPHARDVPARPDQAEREDEVVVIEVRRRSGWQSEPLPVARGTRVEAKGTGPGPGRSRGPLARPRSSILLEGSDIGIVLG